MKKLLILIIVFFNFALGLELSRSNAIVTDTTNQLLWQDDSSVIRIQLSQKDAIEYCNKLSYKGESGWRLPQIDEYKSIVDKNNELNYINKAFKYNIPDGYWSSDTLWRMLGFYGYYMNFLNGIVYYENKTYKKYVRCVKDIK